MARRFQQCEIVVTTWVIATGQFRNLAISEIVADTMEDMDLKLPPTQVDIAEIRRKYHAAALHKLSLGHKAPKGSHKK